MQKHFVQVFCRLDPPPQPSCVHIFHIGVDLNKSPKLFLNLVIIKVQTWNKASPPLKLSGNDQIYARPRKFKFLSIKHAWLSPFCISMK